VSIVLKPSTPIDDLKGQLIVLDAEGRVLHKRVAPRGRGRDVVNIRPATMTSQSSLIVGILADPPANDPPSASTPGHYELEISLEDSPDPPDPGPFPTSGPRPPARAARPHAPSRGSGPSPSPPG
jgi:hypothetical protein